MIEISRQWLNNPEFMETIGVIRDQLDFVLPTYKTNFNKIFHGVELEMQKATQIVQIGLFKHCTIEDGVVKEDEQGPFFKTPQDCTDFDASLKIYFDKTFQIMADPVRLDTIKEGTIPFSQRDKDALAPVIDHEHNEWEV